MLSCTSWGKIFIHYSVIILVLVAVVAIAESVVLAHYLRQNVVVVAVAAIVLAVERASLRTTCSRNIIHFIFLPRSKPISRVSHATPL